MTTLNTFPAPIGVTASFTMVPAGGTTPNFTVMPGLHVISLEFSDATQNFGGDQVTLVQVTAAGGNAANTTVLTMARSGYYNYVVGPSAPVTFNFQTTNGCANVRCTRIDTSIGPS